MNAVAQSKPSLLKKVKRAAGRSGGMVGKSGVSFVLKIMSAIVAFAFNWVVADKLSHDDAGLFFLALSIVMMLATFTRVGMDQAVTRFVAENRADKKWSEIRKCYRLSICIGAVLACAATGVLLLGIDLLATYVFDPELKPTLMVMSLAVCPIAICMLHARFFQGMKQMVGLQLYQNLGASFCFLLVTLVLWLCSIDVTQLNLSAWTLVGSYAFVSCIAVIHWKRASETEFQHSENESQENLVHSNDSQPLSGGGSESSIEEATTASDKVAMPIDARFLLATSIPLWGITMVAMMDRWFGQLVVGAWCEVSEVATFSIALRIAMLISIVVMSVNSISFPTFASLHRQNKHHELQRSALLASWLTLALGLPLALFVVAFPNWLLGFFDPEYQAGANVLRALAIGQIANVASGSVGGLLVMTGHQKESLKISVGTAIGMVLLTLVLVPWLGILGAAVGNALSVSVQMVLCVWMVKKKLGFWPVGLYSPSRPAAVTPS